PDTLVHILPVGGRADGHLGPFGAAQCYDGLRTVAPGERVDEAALVDRGRQRSRIGWSSRRRSRSDETWISHRLLSCRRPLKIWSRDTDQHDDDRADKARG